MIFIYHSIRLVELRKNMLVARKKKTIFEKLSSHEGPMGQDFQELYFLPVFFLF